jgi:hypothetical protein
LNVRFAIFKRTRQFQLLNKSAAFFTLIIRIQLSDHFSQSDHHLTEIITILIRSFNCAFAALPPDSHSRSLIEKVGGH